MTTQTLWQEFRGEVEAFIRRRVNNADDAEDLRQQVYLNVHRHLKAKEPPAHLRGWVYQIARNAITDHRRRKAARPVAQRGIAEADAMAAPASTDADETVRDLAQCLLSMVDRLPEPYRQALKAAELEGLTQREAAARAGLTLSGMKARVQRARVRLRKALLDCCEVEFDGLRNPVSHACRRSGCGEEFDTQSSVDGRC